LFKAKRENEKRKVKVKVFLENGSEKLGETM